MAKEVIKVGSRGTSKRKVAAGAQNWAGKAYKDVMINGLLHKKLQLKCEKKN